MAHASERGGRAKKAPSADYVAREIDLAISAVLRWGIIASVVLIVAGTLAFLFALYLGGQPGTIDQLVNSDGAVLSGPGEMAEGLRAFNPLAIQYLGLSVLMVLPLVPLVLSLYGFLLQRDRAFIAITVFVLGALSVGFVVGLL